MKPILVAVIIVAVTVVLGWVPWFGRINEWSQPRALSVSAVPIPAGEFQIEADRQDPETRVLEFVGGLVLNSKNPDFGALSGLRVDETGALVAVSDTGFWFSGQLKRDARGEPAGIDDGRIAPLLDDAGKPFTRKWASDAEGLTFAGEFAYVSTEQKIRLLQYRVRPDLLTSPSREILFGPLLKDLSYNTGLEAVATPPPGHPQAGKVLMIAEFSADGEADSRAYLWQNGKAEALRVVLHDGFSITDADFLAGGDLLILERRFSLLRGPAMRLRRIAGETIRPGARLDGEVLLELDGRHQIDNSEGLAAFTGPDGRQRIGIVSDDNRWPLQRTLYLEFVVD